MKITIPQNIAELMNALEYHGFQAYVIGGAVRDSLLGLPVHDWDIFTDADGSQILDIFPRGKIIGGEERQRKILTVIVDGTEISSFRGSGDRTETSKDLTKHLATCDFTINALYADKDGNIIDPWNGMMDMTGLQLRWVGNWRDRVREDPLRIFRGLRFIEKFNLRMVDPEPFQSFRDYVGDLPVERVRDEMLKIMDTEYGLTLLSINDILDWWIPSFAETKQHNDHGRYHKESIRDHMMYCHKHMRTYTNDYRLLLAALMHDIGKPSCAAVDEVTGHLMFKNHHEVGATITKNWMIMNKFSDADIIYVTTMVQMHMWSMLNPEPSKKAYAKLFSTLADAGIQVRDFVLLEYCDQQANLADPRRRLADFLRESKILQTYHKMMIERDPFTIKDLEVDGNDLIKLGVPQGRQIGVQLNSLFGLVMDGVLPNSKPELMSFVRKQMLRLE